MRSPDQRSEICERFVLIYNTKVRSPVKLEVKMRSLFKIVLSKELSDRLRLSGNACWFASEEGAIATVKLRQKLYLRHHCYGHILNSRA
jgi:hypothetical protein